MQAKHSIRYIKMLIKYCLKYTKEQRGYKIPAFLFYDFHITNI